MKNERGRQNLQVIDVITFKYDIMNYSRITISLIIMEVLLCTKKQKEA